jgi:hypothetical protein
LWQNPNPSTPSTCFVTEKNLVNMASEARKRTDKDELDHSTAVDQQARPTARIVAGCDEKQQAGLCCNSLFL